MYGHLNLIALLATLGVSSAAVVERFNSLSLSFEIDFKEQTGYKLSSDPSANVSPTEKDKTATNKWTWSTSDLPKTDTFTFYTYEGYSETVKDTFECNLRGHRARVDGHVYDDLDTHKYTLIAEAPYLVNQDWQRTADLQCWKAGDDHHKEYPVINSNEIAWTS
ncbi:uncharacterized protein L201_005473 [Kwoniella dendrophila CBS 6074]|uniref:AA1-like domain-containing protein n=1 Tax=Kwoniella dendrophila CBS 6074 TaxID=1295534 RepID=A0AAX4K0U8_9TREE